LEEFEECRLVTVVHVLVLGLEAARSSHLGKCLLTPLRNPKWPNRS